MLRKTDITVVPRYLEVKRELILFLLHSHFQTYVRLVKHFIESPRQKAPYDAQSAVIAVHVQWATPVQF